MTVFPDAEAPELQAELRAYFATTDADASDHFHQRAQEVSSSNPALERALRLLSDVCSLHLDASNSNEPLRIRWKGKDGARTFSPTDLSDEGASFLASLLRKLEPHSIAARIGDLLWLQRRDGRAAIAAARAYLFDQPVEPSVDFGNGNSTARCAGSACLSN